MGTVQRPRSARPRIKGTQHAARNRTLARLLKSVPTELSEPAAKSRQRGGKPGDAVERRTRTQDERGNKRGIETRSKMGKWDLIKAIRREEFVMERPVPGPTPGPLPPDPFPEPVPPVPHPDPEPRPEPVP